MKAKLAIEILNKQREKLIEKKAPKDETWTSQTASYIKEFFGEESVEYIFIKNFNFSVIGHTGMSDEIWRRELAEKERKVLQFITNCIETIECKGIYKPPRVNFLQGVSSNALWTIFSISVPGLLTVGYLFGQFTTDTKNIELRQEVQKLKDSLLEKPKTLISIPIQGTDSGKTENN